MTRSLALLWILGLGCPYNTFSTGTPTHSQIIPIDMYHKIQESTLSLRHQPREAECLRVIQGPGRVDYVGSKLQGLLRVQGTCGFEGSKATPSLGFNG